MGAVSTAKGLESVCGRDQASPTAPTVCIWSAPAGLISRPCRTTALRFQRCPTLRPGRALLWERSRPRRASKAFAVETRRPQPLPQGVSGRLRLASFHGLAEQPPYGSSDALPYGRGALFCGGGLDREGPRKHSRSRPGVPNRSHSAYLVGWPHFTALPNHHLTVPAMPYPTAGARSFVGAVLTAKGLESIRDRSHDGSVTSRPCQTTADG